MAKPWKVLGVRPSDPFGDAARTIVATKYCELVSYAPEAVASPDEPLIHDMRIAAKRLREALKLVRDGLSREGAKPALAAVEGLNEGLGSVRDCDVLLLWTERAGQEDLSEAEREALECVRALTTREREERLHDLQQGLGTMLAITLPAALRDLVGRKRITRVVRRHG